MRPVVSVQEAAGTDGAGRALAVRQLRPGESVRFVACACYVCEADLVLPVPRRISAVGRVIAYVDHWRLDNPGPVPLTVQNLELPQDLITVPAGRAGVVISFELAGVNAGQLRLVTVFGPEPAGQPARITPCPGTPGHRPERSLDPRTTYFAVLVALCEPRLLRSVDAMLPTSEEIAQRLCHRGIPMTARAVDWHIEYLVDRLGLRSRGPTVRSKRSWRKEAVAAAALRQLLIGPEHLPEPTDRRQ